jgi:6-phosphogluconate dehydrogenase
MPACDIGLIGLAVMGENLVLNMEDHGFRVAVFNRTVSKVDEFTSGAAKGRKIVGTHSLQEFVAALQRPRRVMLMVKAGQPVDDFIDQVVSLLAPGDIVIDGGNSHFADTERRTKAIESKGLLYIGTGVSGGEEGARYGPSIMPGGSPAAWPAVRPIFQAIAAKVADGSPCCQWVGAGGAGHYVKMVHNGIEYGDMQLICEAYMILSEALGLTAAALHRVFDEWNRGPLNSYLIEITRDIFTVTDGETSKPLVELIVDTAGQKGTGKWASQHALDLGVPTMLITEAVFARCLSALKAERVRAAAVLPGPMAKPYSGDRAKFIEAIRDALYASKICSYAQGFAQMRAATGEAGWNLNFGDIALMWRGGCIIRAAFLDRIKEAFTRNAQLDNLLLDPYFRDAVGSAQANWRHVVATAVELGIPVPAFSSALAYFDGYRRPRLPANLLQAQRDYFGAHTYQRIDKPGTFHTDWIRERKLCC